MYKKAVLNYLNNNGGPSEYLDVILAVENPDSEVVFCSKDSFLIKTAEKNMAFMVASTQKESDAMAEKAGREGIKEICMRPVEFAKNTAQVLGISLNFRPCYLASQREPVIIADTKNIDFQPLTMRNMDYVLSNYNMAEILGRDYIQERIKSKKMWGGFLNDKLFGFIGCHSEGSMGMLYVAPSYRRQGLARALEAELINYLVSNKKHPYCHIFDDNKASMNLQKSLGLQLSKQKLIWL